MHLLCCQQDKSQALATEALAGVAPRWSSGDASAASRGWGATTPLTRLKRSEAVNMRTEPPVLASCEPEPTATTDWWATICDSATPSSQGSLTRRSNDEMASRRRGTSTLSPSQPETLNLLPGPAPAPQQHQTGPAPSGSPFLIALWTTPVRRLPAAGAMSVLLAACDDPQESASIRVRLDAQAAFHHSRTSSWPG